MAEKVAEVVPHHSVPWVLDRLRGLRERLQRVDVTLQMLLPKDRPRSGSLGEVVRVVAELIRDPVKLQEIQPEDIPPVLATLAALETALAARLMVAAREGVDNPATEPGADRLLAAREAADILGVSVDYLYRHAGALPFAVRPTPGTLRFSAQGIARYIRRKQAKLPK
jgi:hypothetical protein